MIHLVLRTYGYDTGNRVDGSMVELNAEGGELLAKPASRWNVPSSLGRNANELSLLCVNTELREACISNHETS